VIDARTALMTTNDMVSVRPLVILAIRMMGPGRRRLEMVRLAHDMNDARRDVQRFTGRLHVAINAQPQASRSHQGAA
jgi:hypothetical protein